MLQISEALKQNITEIVTRIREPENPYDEYAIRIDVDRDGKPGYNPAATDLGDRSFMLGYVPRAYNKVFARLMDAGKLLYGTVRHKELIAGYYKIVIKIYMKD